MAKNEPRAHHTLPRFYQAGFANDREQVRVVDRSTGAEFTTNTVNVAQRRDWNAFEDEDGRRRQEVEKLLADEIDTPAAAGFALLRQNDFPFADERNRASVARFVAAQLTRGVGQRENIIEFLSEVMSMSIRVAAHNAPDKWWERAVGEVPSEAMRKRLVAQDGSEVKPTRALVLQTLVGPIDEVAKIVFMRSWSLVTFPQPWLFTSEDPVILTGPRDMPLGVGTADEIVLPVSPSAALVMFHPEPWEYRLARASRNVASRLNTWHLAVSPSERLLLHPDTDDHPLDAKVAGAIPDALLHALGRGPVDTR